jgi:two-component system chemotaxis response regulator CheY
MRFLVVDDFKTMRRVLCGQLREMGFETVDEAADGRAALERLRAEPADVVITDIEMPIMNGFDLLSAIKGDKRLKHLPVLVLAAEARKDDIVRCIQAGAAAYLVKPFGRATLEEKLRQIAPDCFVNEQVPAAVAPS